MKSWRKNSGVCTCEEQPAVPGKHDGREGTRVFSNKKRKRNKSVLRAWVLAKGETTVHDSGES
jgi:hypothetical protein